MEASAIAKRLLRRALSAAWTGVEVTAIGVAVWLIGARAGAFTGTPKGFDATGHLSKARFIMDNWPHVSWNYEWYSGEPAFSDYPGYHVLLALIATVGHISLPDAMKGVSYTAMLCAVAGLYATVRAATGSRVSGLIAAGLLMGTPTLWGQVVVLGLYPRFAGLGMMSVALAAAVAHSRRGGRWRAALTCLLLALCLSMHPIVGMIAVGLVVGIYLLDTGHSATRRCVAAAAVILAGFGLDAYFYLPLGLSSRSQSLFTDTEVSLSWSMLLHPKVGHLDGLTLWLVPLGIVMVGFALWQLVPPEVPFAEKAALGTDITFLSTASDHPVVPPEAGPAVRRYLLWSARMRTLGLAYRMALLFALGSGIVFAYGLIGLAVPHFRFYVNGLQPYDLLVYPAYLLSGVVGLVIEPLRRTVGSWLLAAFPGVLANALRVAIPIAALCAAVSVIGVTAWNTSGTLKGAESDNADVPQRASLLPAESAGQMQYRFAGASDSVTEWVNDYSSVPQTRGYDDHAALHLDWQVWLETSLLKASAPAPERKFLLDWYGVKWIDADAGSGDLTQYDSNPAAYTPLNSWIQPGVHMQTYRYRQATPILSASSAPAVLIVGDDQHYDLMIRALALDGVDSTQLIPVHGPVSIDDLTPALLKSFQGVVLYGAKVGNPAKDAATLSTFVKAGGGLYVDGAEDSADIGRLVGVPGSPLPVTAVTETTVPDTGWDWTSYGDPTVVSADLAGFGKPAFASSGGWSTETVTHLAPWARPVLSTVGKDVVASGTLGAGKVVWEGLNLPYHLATYRSGPEAAFLAHSLLSTVRTAGPVPASTAVAVNGQSWKIATAGAAGVLLKVQDAPGWHATINGAKATIYPAGPGMMWIPVPGGPVRVAVNYRLSLVEKAGYLGSLLTIVLILIFLMSARARRLFVRTGGMVDGPVLLVPLPRKETLPVRSRAWEPLPLDFGS